MFWDNYKRLCANVGKTPSRVVQELGLVRSVVTRWKGGTLPRPTVRKQIAAYFGVSEDTLLSARRGNAFSCKIGSRQPYSRNVRRRCRKAFGYCGYAFEINKKRGALWSKTIGEKTPAGS